MPNHQSHTRGSHPTSKYNKYNNGSAENEEIALLKNKYASELPTLRELFPTWSEEDILFALQENQGDLMLTIDRISEGFATQWDEVKTAKPKKEAPFNTQNTRNQSQQPVQDKTKPRGKAPVSSRGPKNGPGPSSKKSQIHDAATIEKHFQELRLNSETTAWDEQPINDAAWDNDNQDSWGKSKSNHTKHAHQTSKGKGNKNKTEAKEEPPKPAVKSWASIVKPKSAEPAKPKAPTQPPKPELIEHKQEQQTEAPEVPLEDKKEEILPVVEQATEPELVSEVAKPEQIESSTPSQTAELPSTDVPAVSQIPEQQIPAPVPSSIPVPASVPISQNASGVKFGNFQTNTNITPGNAPSFGSLNFSQTQRASLPPGLSLPNQVPPSSRPGQSASALPASAPYSRPAQQAQEQPDAPLNAAPSASPNAQASMPRGPAPPGNLNNTYSNSATSQFSDNKSPFPNYYHPSKFNPHQRPNVGIPPAYTQQYAHPQQGSYQQHNPAPYPTAQFEYHQQNETSLLSNPTKKESPAVESNNLTSASSATAQPTSTGSANSSAQQHSYHHQANETLTHTHPQQQFQHHQQQQPHFNHNIYQQHSQYYHDSYMHTQPYNPYTYDPYTQHYTQPHYQPQQYQSGYTHPSTGNYAHPNSRSNKPFWTTKH